MQPLNDKQVSDFAATLNDQGDKSVFLDLAQKGDWKTLHGHFPDAYKGVKVETTTPPAAPAAPETPAAPAAPETPAAPAAPETPAAPAAPKPKATKKAGK